MTKKKGLPSFAARTRIVREQCHVRGCDGTVTRQEQPVLYTPDDLVELRGKDWVENFKSRLKPVKGAPKDALVCDTALHAGCTIWKCIDEALMYSQVLGRPIAFNFNEQPVIVREGDDKEKLVRRWWKRAYGETPEESWERR